MATIKGIKRKYDDTHNIYTAIHNARSNVKNARDTLKKAIKEKRQTYGATKYTKFFPIWDNPEIGARYGTSYSEIDYNNILKLKERELNNLLTQEKKLKSQGKIFSFSKLPRRTKEQIIRSNDPSLKTGKRTARGMKF